jgi:NADH:ubiquinone oxidoreductase subunit F (NADH-binding)
VIVALGQEACPVAETARVADWFATESAGQCGPCVHGLDAVADTIQRVATGTASGLAA